MSDNLINSLIASGVASGLYFFCDVSLEASLLIGFVALAAYSLTDISRHLRKK